MGDKFQFYLPKSGSFCRNKTKLPGNGMGECEKKRERFMGREFNFGLL